MLGFHVFTLVGLRQPLVHFEPERNKSEFCVLLGHVTLTAGRFSARSERPTQTTSFHSNGSFVGKSKDVVVMMDA